jgi:hypothetical protein
MFVADFLGCSRQIEDHQRLRTSYFRGRESMIRRRTSAILRHQCNGQVGGVISEYYQSNAG